MEAKVSICESERFRARVLLVHNRYLQGGGEDRVLELEAALLREHGHAVDVHVVDKKDVSKQSRLGLAYRAVWNRAAMRSVAERARAHRADVVHFHNVQPMLSQAVYALARRGGAAIVQTLHNYRAICPGALLQRDDKPCEDCVRSRFAWRGIKNRCYRESRAATAVVAVGNAFHELRGTWRDVDRFLVLNPFAHERFAEGRLPEDRMVLKPNWVPGPERLDARERSGVLFVGRLTAEKGLRVLLRAVEAAGPKLGLTIIGSGPLEGESRAVAARAPWIRVLGSMPPERVHDAMQSASVLAFPSQWYEMCPMVLLEAFAHGLPVVASDLGAMRSIVEHARQGFRVRPADELAWRRSLSELAADPVRARMMGGAARATWEDRYSPAAGYRALRDAYQMAMTRRREAA